MKSGIYKITNSITGMYYIGSSKNVYSRWNKHKSELRLKKHRNSKLQRSYNKYGLSSFTFEFIEEVQEKDLLKIEQSYLDTLDKSKIYNLVFIAGGGDLISGRPDEKKIREEKSYKIKEHLKNNPVIWTEEMRTNRASKTKEWFSIPENKESWSKKRLGKGNSFYGKYHSKETKLKIREANLGKKPINRRKVSINNIVYESVTEASRQLKVCPATIIHRIKSPNPKFVNYSYINI